MGAHVSILGRGAWLLMSPRPPLAREEHEKLSAEYHIERLRYTWYAVHFLKLSIYRIALKNFAVSFVHML